MTVIVSTFSNQQIEAFQSQFVTIYRDAFKAPPYCKGEEEAMDFAQSLPQHVEREGFRMVVAVEDGAGTLVGFSYGYQNIPGQLWHEEVARAVQPQIVAEWLMNTFRLVEMAVALRAQRQGIGGLLHDHLLSKLPYRKVVLSTMAAETNAYRMYQKRGWQVLVEEVIFPGVARPYRVMGLELGEEREDAV
ncbi:MAG: GNAT family N-acetyltransferase [Chloroflexi bacterium]|nr:GNAT family N-acetyltransferase [Chloroflexota bacterium]MBU1749478.1 GNAT family N-acetyltransferase [Chloroflexota bacterium]MBU1878926.1 GNAT family N-acetyltransferase [Chloroflexota bacterium]